MAGPNLELFKFSLYLFFPLAIMIHYGDPQWYHDNVRPVRDKFWPDEASLYKPPRNAADLKSELEGLRAQRLANKDRREQGLPPIVWEKRAPDQTQFSAPSSIAEPSTPSLREGGSLGSVWAKEHPSPSITQRQRTWRETWQTATERHVV